MRIISLSGHKVSETTIDQSFFKPVRAGRLSLFVLKLDNGMKAIIDAATGVVLTVTDFASSALLVIKREIDTMSDEAWQESRLQFERLSGIWAFPMSQREFCLELG